MVDIKTIESWLWKAACSIRGSVDAPKFKDYILPLIFLKRLSDIYDDEVEKLAIDFGTNDKIDQLIEKDKGLVRFYIPKEASWKNIRKLTTKIGEGLSDAARLIAKENPRLQGVIDVVDFNSTVSGQRIISDEKLSKLIEIINEHRLGLKDAEPDVLGRAYEYLLRKFAEGQGQSAGEFYTPKEIGWLMAYILDPQEGQEAYDPACGSGGLLVKCALALRQKNKKIEKPLKLYGQEINHVTFAMAKMNMIIHDMEGEIAIGDTFRNPKFLTGSSLRKFDLVTANPMWNQDGYDTDFYENDQYDRFPFGFPNASSADWGWIQHMTSSLNDKGRGAVVLDTGAVSRGSGGKGTNKENEIRKALVEKDWIEGVLLLPENLFYNTPAAGVIIFLNKNKPKEKQGKIILINASKEFEKSSESSKNIVPEASIKRVSSAYHTFKDVEGLAKVITKSEAIKNDCNLNIAKYVKTINTSIYETPENLIKTIGRKTIEENAIEKDIIKNLETSRQEATKDNSQWKTFVFEDIAEYICGGGTPSTKIPEYWNGEIAWLTPSDVTAHKKIFLDKTSRRITESGLKNSSAKICQPQSILMTSRATIGEAIINTVPMTTNQGFINFYCNPKIADTLFVYFWIKHNKEYLNSLGTGSTFKEISRGKFKKIEIKLPPLDIQKFLSRLFLSVENQIELQIEKKENYEELGFSVLNEFFKN